MTDMPVTQKKSRFWLGLGIFSLVFLLLVAVGLMFFWDFIASYENSRPQNAVEGYMLGVTAQSISQLPNVLPEGYDSALQSEEAARQAIAQSIGTISYVRNTKLSTDSKMVYMVLSGGKAVGSVSMTVGRTDRYGFEYWSVTEENYDFSHLIGESVSITVPEEYPVYANGQRLDESYITESGIPYASVEAYYADYQLPAMCTYTAGPILGDITLTVTDPDGNPVEITADTDMEQFLKNCPQEEIDAVDAFLQDYVQRYIDFTAATGGKEAMYHNYNELVKLIVPDSMLAIRMKEAMIGLIWITDRSASVTDVSIHRCLSLEEGRWLCDFSYTVDSRDYNGRVQSVTNVQMVLVDVDGQMMAETMITK